MIGVTDGFHRGACRRLVALGVVLMMGTSLAGGAARPEEMAARDRWVKEHLSPAKPPFSFLCGGQPSGDLLAGWQPKVGTETLDRGRSQRTIAWSDSKTGLAVRCVVVEYSDYPAVEWTAYLRNDGKADTPILEKVQGVDVRFEAKPEDAMILRTGKGDTCRADLYQPLEQKLAAGASVRFAPAGGRATNGAFPYYNLQLPGGGVILAVGWPGQWAATFTRDAQGGLAIVAGQERVRLVLRPGEEIRTPLVAMLFWAGGDVQRSQNLWRRWMWAHNVPRTADGKLPPPILHGNTSGPFNEMINANEANQKLFLDRYRQEGVKIDFWWMDAGWYPCDGQWPKTGTWEPDLKRFPNGLRAISDHARAQGVKTLVWFEPERVAGGTWLATNHPEWLLGSLLNLGNPDVRKWLTDHVDGVIRQQGIDLYRQDFNMDPLSSWRKNDAADRQGMTENLHVQGYLAYWDELRKRNPGLIIDSCASGGRRNDLETMRRAVPLHPTDYNYGHLAAKQAFHQALFQWLPYFGSNTVPVDSVTAYAFRSGHAMSVVLGYDMRRKELDYALLRKLAEEWRQVVPYYQGDYYPLTPYSVDEVDWAAWQFHRSQEGDGIIQAFRRPKSTDAKRTFRLGGLDPAGQYVVAELGSDAVTKNSGRELMEQGLVVEIPDKPGAVVISYRLAQPAKPDDKR